MTIKLLKTSRSLTCSINKLYKKVNIVIKRLHVTKLKIAVKTRQFSIGIRQQTDRVSCNTVNIIGHCLTTTMCSGRVESMLSMISSATMFLIHALLLTI